MIISIVNQQGHNYGDEAAGCALIQELCKISDVEKINVFYASDSIIPISHIKVQHYVEITLKSMGLHNIMVYLLFNFKNSLNNIRNKELQQFVATIFQSDIVFVSPCGASIGIYKDWRYLLRLLIVTKTGKSPIFHFNTIGKSGNVIFDFVSKCILKKSKVYVREKASFEYLRKIGINSMVGPDSAFLLSQISPKEKKELAFVPTHLDDWHPYFKKRNVDNFICKNIIPLIASFGEKYNIKIKIIPHFNLIEEKEYCETILEHFKKEGLKENQVYVCQSINSYMDYDYEIANSRFVIGMRYHAIVLAAKNATPFISLAYENKMKEVSTYMGQCEYCIDLFEKDYEKIMNQIALMMDQLLLNENKIQNELDFLYIEKNKEVKKIIERYCKKEGL